MNRKDYARRKGRSSSFIRRATRMAIYNRDNFVCYICLQKFLILDAFLENKLSVDHFITRSNGGNHRHDNLITCCIGCNARRKNKNLDSKTRKRALRRLKKPINREAGALIVKFRDYIRELGAYGPRV